MSLVKRIFQLFENIKFDCYIVTVVDERANQIFWFNGLDIAEFLGFPKPRRIISEQVMPKLKMSWNDLKEKYQVGVTFSTDWQSHTILISEPGLYSLITQSKNPIAEKFMDWMCTDILPSLRKGTLYTNTNDTLQELSKAVVMLNKNLNEVKSERAQREDNTNANDTIRELSKTIITLNEDLSEARRESERSRRDTERMQREAFTLSQRMTSMVRDVIAKPNSPDLLHALIVHELKPNEFAFTRCQQRSLQKAIKRIKNQRPEAHEIYRSIYVPNGVNILNCVKDWLREKEIYYSSRDNRIRLWDELKVEKLITFIENIVRINV